MIEINHIKDKMQFDEGSKKCGGSAQATAGRSFTEPALSPFGANLYSVIDQCRDGSAGFERAGTDGKNSQNPRWSPIRLFG
jgi:hypothetical protein